MKINYDNLNRIFISKIQLASYECKIVAGSIIQHVKLYILDLYYNKHN